MPNIHATKTQLSRLIAEVQSGHEVVITKAGRPVAKLVRYEGPPTRRRTPGGWEGRVWMAPDFDTLPDEILDAFEGA